MEGETPSLIAIPVPAAQEALQDGGLALQQEPDIIPLSDRLPMIGDVLVELQKDYHVQKILQTPGIFTSPESRQAFISSFFQHVPASEDFWDIAGEYMADALTMNVPTKPSHVKRCKDEYECDVSFILDEHFAQLNTD